MSRSKVFFKMGFAEWIASLLEFVYVPSSTHMLGGHFFALIIFRSHISNKFETFTITNTFSLGSGAVSI